MVQSNIISGHADARQAFERPVASRLQGRHFAWQRIGRVSSEWFSRPETSATVS